MRRQTTAGTKPSRAGTKRCSPSPLREKQRADSSSLSNPSNPNGVDPSRARSIRARLRNWYTRNARDLPWRHATDPYHIWVSEVMLQQTQVSTVVPYYRRFIQRFPTLQSLAGAETGDVLKLWQGLGYYRRAVNLQQAARQVVKRFGAVVPAHETSLRQLPGVGRYIAGAIRSFAFNLPAPILEANSARVLCRLFGIRGRLTEATNQQRLWELSGQLLPRRDAGRHNQALMELGALVCVAGCPRCQRCPLADLCEARNAGLAEQLPDARPSRQFVDVHDAAAIIRRRGRVLIVQRPLDARWGGLWELPRTTVRRGADPIESLRSFVRASLNLEIDVGHQVLTVKHAVTHHRVTLSCYECRIVSGHVRASGHAACRWERPDRLDRYAASSPQRKLIAAIQGK